MTERPILYSFRRCPYAMRARMALAVSGTVCRLREVELRNKPAELIAASPKGTVPVLVAEIGAGAGQVIDESLAIMSWALARNDPEGWLAGDDPDLIARNDGPFKQALDRYKYPNRYDLHDSSPYREAGLESLVLLNQRLEKSAYLTGNHRALADVAIFPFVRQFAEVDRGWFEALPLAALQRWLGEHLASALFASVMTRYAAWRAGQPEPLFPAGA